MPSNLFGKVWPSLRRWCHLWAPWKLPPPLEGVGPRWGFSERRDTMAPPGGMPPSGNWRVWVSVAGGTPSETCEGEDLLGCIRLWFSFSVSWTERRNDPYLFHYQSWHWAHALPSVMGRTFCRESTACSPKFYSLPHEVLAILSAGFAFCQIKGNEKAIYVTSFWRLRS